MSEKNFEKEKSKANAIEESASKEPVNMIGSNYKLHDEIIKCINIDENIILKHLRNEKGDYIDIRRYYKQTPTKKGVRFKLNNLEKIKVLFDKKLKK